MKSESKRCVVRYGRDKEVFELGQRLSDPILVEENRPNLFPREILNVFPF